MAQLTADQLGACTVPAHLLSVSLGLDDNGHSSHGVTAEKAVGFRSVIAASSSSTGLSILVESDDLLIGLVTVPNEEDVPVTLN